MAVPVSATQVVTCVVSPGLPEVSGLPRYAQGPTARITWTGCVRFHLLVGILCGTQHIMRVATPTDAGIDQIVNHGPPVQALLIGAALYAHPLREVAAPGWRVDTAALGLRHECLRSYLRSWRRSGDRDAIEVVLVGATVEDHVRVAAQCLDEGVDHLFIEAPVFFRNPDARALAADPGRQIVVSSNLRFAYQLPDYRWALLDLISRGALAGDPGAERSAVAVFGRVVDLFDVAYAVNGPIRSSQAVGRRCAYQFDIQHDNMASTYVDFNWCGRSAPDQRAFITAFDDGVAVQALHQPLLLKPLSRREAAAREIRHLLNVVLKGARPANTIKDAAYVHRWALELCESMGLNLAADAGASPSGRSGLTTGKHRSDF